MNLLLLFRCKRPDCRMWRREVRLHPLPCNRETFWSQHHHLDWKTIFGRKRRKWKFGLQKRRESRHIGSTGTRPEPNTSDCRVLTYCPTQTRQTKHNGRKRNWIRVEIYLPNWSCKHCCNIAVISLLTIMLWSYYSLSN